MPGGIIGTPSTTPSLNQAIGTPYTLLSLERWRQISGINPMHFWGGAGETYFPNVNQCDDVFYNFYWQNENNVSREEIARAIQQAESDITGVLGYSPAPHWVEEVVNYPQHHRRDVMEWGMMDVRGLGKAIRLGEGRFISAGQRLATLVAANTSIVRTDEDSDGYNETVTITAATTVTDACQLHVYFAGTSADPDWEIRSPRSVTISGGNVVFKFFSWQFLSYEQQQAFQTTSQVTPIDIESATSYITKVDVYQITTDFTQTSATFYWERARLYSLGLMPIGWCCSSCGTTGCPACEFITQDGCLKVKDADGQFGVPQPATYDSDTGQWDNSTQTVCRDPDMVRIWYYAGEQAQNYLAGRTCDPLNSNLANAIAWLATARVNRPFCTCNNALTLLNNLQRDMAFTGSRELGSFQVSAADMDNPFGTRLGEVKAWHIVSRLASNLMVGVAV